MALGGGTFIAQNKILPGTYINIVSAANANAQLSDRGIAAVGVKTGWGVAGQVFEISNADFQKNSLELLGLPYTDEKLKGLREIFLHASTVLAFRLDGGGSKATSALASAKCPGTVGNSIKITVRQNVDDTSKFDVITFIGSSQVDIQTASAYVKTTDISIAASKTYYTKNDTVYTAVESPVVSDIESYYEAGTAAQLAANGYVDFKSDAVLSATAGISLTGGTDSEVTGEAHQSLLDAMEACSFNTLGCVSDDETIKSLYIAFCKRLRDDMGQKCQVVVHNKAADYEGVINVKNNISDSNASGAELVYWVTGAAAGTAVNKSASNMLYDGEYDINTSYSQKQLENAIQAGEFTFHKVGNDVRVLTDINSLVTVSDTKGGIFKKNQTIRVTDQIANDIAVVFNTNYLGTVPNDETGRMFLKNDVTALIEQLQAARAIQGFDSEDVTINQGDEPTSVIVTAAVIPVNAMEKLYMTVTVN